MMNPLRKKWDGVYQRTCSDTRPQPAYVLQAYDYLLPTQGFAVDLACGLGGNALFLAARGLPTRAWDLSPVAIARLNRIAEQDRLELVAEACDLETIEWPCRCFDVVVMTRFLDRSLNKAVMDTLRPGGMLYFQTFIRDKNPSVGPGNPEYLLAENELAELFPGLILRAYCEAGQVGDLAKGFRNEALLVGQKPSSTSSLTKVR